MSLTNVFSQFNDTVIAPSVIKSAVCPNPNSSAFNSRYKNAETFIPVVSQPHKTINVNFNIFQKLDHSGNFQENPTDLARLNQIFNWFNSMYSSINSVSKKTPIISLNSPQARSYCYQQYAGF